MTTTKTGERGLKNNSQVIIGLQGKSHGFPFRLLDNNKLRVREKSHWMKKKLPQLTTK